LKNIYTFNIKLLTAIAPPLFALAVAWSPLFSRILIGTEQQDFIAFTAILTLPMGINLFANPAYFSNLGTGRVWWNTAAHTLMGLLNGIFGFVLGPLFGAYGVVIGMAIAMAAGSLLVIFGFHRDNKLSWMIFSLDGSIPLLLVSVITAVAGIEISHLLLRSHSLSIPMCGAWIFISLIPVSLAIWKHPMFNVILDSVLHRGSHKN
jgi:O-antigen/teichoic acid export membrane protein